MATDVKKKSPRRTFNTVHATRGVWLVKVPNYLSEAWRKAGKGESLGKMKITLVNYDCQIGYILIKLFLLLEEPTKHRYEVSYYFKHVHTMTFQYNVYVHIYIRT